MITNEVVNKSIDYILEHLNEDILIEDVANYCHFSKYYFSRIFKAETGESVYSFIKRLRIEKSAVLLKVEQEKTITNIGEGYGYSASNYSSLFRSRYNMSPASFRKKQSELTTMKHPIYKKETQYQEYEYYNQRVEIRRFDDITVVYERYIGNYSELQKQWTAFMDKYNHLWTDKSMFIERSYDDPTLTDINQCMYDICMTVEESCLLENQMTIQGGTYIVYHFEGAVSEIFEAFQGIFNIWLPKSRFTLDNRHGFEIYKVADCHKDYFVMEMCIPIQ